MALKSPASTSDTQQSDKQLKKILLQIHHHLRGSDQHWLLHAVKRIYFQKCCYSWARISAHIEKFLQDPKIHYSSLMTILEIEKEKFSASTFYGQQLRELEQLFSRGYEFTLFKRPDW